MNVDLHSVSLMEDAKTEVTGINTLNDDCLMHIIQYLPIVDRVRIERVCKRWRVISLDSWHNFKSLNFENKCWGFSKSETLFKISRRIFKKVLNRCGNYLTSIQFMDYNERLGPNILKSVAGFCPNIQNLDASDLEVSPCSLKALAKKCHKLVSFAVGNCTDKCDCELSLLFANNRDLKRLCLQSNLEVTGECLKALNSHSIENIIFTSCPWITLDNFHVVRSYHNLKQLVLEDYLDLNNDIMEDISSCSKSLQYLSLSVGQFYTDSLMQIAKLWNLHSLDLSSNTSVDDEVLVTIGANCTLLKQVDISFCNEVTNAGLASIVSLPNLESLFILGLNNVDDQVFRAMPALRQMDCSYCTNLRDAGLVRLIEESENVEHLYLNRCENLSNELLDAAIKATKKRKNQVVLKLYLSNTDLLLGKASDTSPFLRVVPMIIVTNAYGRSESVLAPHAQWDFFLLQETIKMSVEQKKDVKSPYASTQEHVEADQMEINTLNDDCLMHIIQYLPIADRVRIERVCKRWLAISLDSWHSFKSLNFYNECWGLNKPETLTNEIFKKVLNRCGKFLMSIVFLGSIKRLGPNVLSTVARFCPNIQNLDVAELDEVSPWSLRVLSEKCSKLVSFVVGSCNEEILLLLFENNKELKKLYIEDFGSINEECLKKLNGYFMEEVICENCSSFNPDTIQVVKDFRKLKQLVLNNYVHSNNDTMKYISSCYKSLEYLTLSHGFSGPLQQVAKLTNLKELDLSSNKSVVDEVLVSIGANCKLLKHVNISDCNEVTNTGLASIVSLPNLESLLIEYLQNINDQVFRAMPALRQMDCNYCANLRDAGLIKLIQGSKNLQHLYLRNCKNISSEFSEMAMKATKNRENQINLVLHWETWCRLPEFPEYRFKEIK